MRLYFEEGNASEALRRYREYRALLQRKLGLAPSARMEELLAGLGREHVVRVS
jgi:DNA-binding SARP family transcriptional activator